MSQIIRVGIGAMGLAGPGETLFTVVGSCVAVMLYDKKLRLGGMLHLMLGFARGRSDNPCKYADTGIPYLRQAMIERGALAQRLIGAKIAGGGAMFNFYGKEENVAAANVQAVHQILAAEGIQIIREDCGGTNGRRILFEPANGKVTVSIQNQPDRIL